MSATQQQITLTFEEMTVRYSGEWLLIGNSRLSPSLHVISGEVLAHSRSRDEIYRQLGLVQGKRVSIEFAGPIPADLAVAL